MRIFITGSYEWLQDCIAKYIMGDDHIILREYDEEPGGVDIVVHVDMKNEECINYPGAPLLYITSLGTYGTCNDMNQTAMDYIKRNGGVYVRLCEIYGDIPQGNANIIMDLIEEAMYTRQLDLRGRSFTPFQIIHYEDALHGIKTIIDNMSLLLGEQIDITSFAWVSIKDIVKQIHQLYITHFEHHLLVRDEEPYNTLSTSTSTSTSTSINICDERSPPTKHTIFHDTLWQPSFKLHDFILEWMQKKERPIV